MSAPTLASLVIELRGSCASAKRAKRPAAKKACMLRVYEAGVALSTRTDQAAMWLDENFDRGRDETWCAVLTRYKWARRALNRGERCL